MIWESALGSAIEVAIAIAGFSGIVAAVGRRGAGEWTESDQLRLRILLTASGASLGFAFLPFLLTDALPAALVWRIASGLMAGYLAAISALRFRQATLGGITRAIGMSAPGLFLQACMISLLAANAIWLASSSVYILGVLWVLFVGFMAFVTLLLGSWRQRRAEPAPARPEVASPDAGRNESP